MTSIAERDEIPCGEAIMTEWNAIPLDVQAKILQSLECRDVLRFKAVSKTCQKLIESDDFRKSWRAGIISEGVFTAISYYIKDNEWRWSAFDLHSNSWIALPTFLCLPPPDAELFKEYSMTGHGGLLCAEVSKLPNKGHLVVFNPLTAQKRALPPLLHPRNPVLVHISVDSATKSFMVIVAGSSTASDEHLSRKMEIFDSATSEWKEACDLPGPVFGLNEHQSGVYLDQTLYFISFLEGDCRKGVVAFHVGTGKWLKNKTCPIPFSACSNTLQLVESDGKVYLFSEQEQGRSVEHCIDVLESFPNPETGAVECQWRNVVRVRKSGGRGLLVYPEHTCVGFGAGRLCIFNGLQRDGVVYNMQDGKQCEVLEPPPADQKGDKFFTLNPASFTFLPSFDTISEISQDHDHNRRTEQAELQECQDHDHNRRTEQAKLQECQDHDHNRRTEKAELQECQDHNHNRRTEQAELQECQDHDHNRRTEQAELQECQDHDHNGRIEQAELQECPGREETRLTQHLDQLNKASTTSAFQKNTTTRPNRLGPKCR